jgi:molecular chaperone GrpE
MMKAFSKNGLEPVECEVGADFDPNLHNAMFEVPTQDVEAGKIAAVIKQGYALRGRVIRATDVGIAQASP